MAILRTSPLGVTEFFYGLTFGPVITYVPGQSFASAGTVPPGLTVFADNLSGTSHIGIQGVPTTAGVYNFTTDSLMSNGSHQFNDWVVTVSAKPSPLGGSCPFITLTPSPLSEMALATAFTQQMVASGGTGPYVWDLALGSLPPGLTFSAGGLLSGTPTTLGTYNFTLRATDVNTCPGVLAFSVTVLAESSAVDYWTTTPANLFPVSRILIISPNVGTNYSRGKAVTMLTGTPLTRFPATNLVDDSADVVLRISEQQFELYVDLGVDRTPDALALFNHNIDPTRLVSVYVGTTSSIFTRLGSFAAGFRNGWLDLRAFPVRTGRYWKVKLTSNNSVSITLGELVVGSAFVMEGVLSENWTRAAKYFVERAFTEEMLPYKMHSGARARQLQMSFLMDPTNRAIIEQVFDDAGITGNRVVVIPDTRKNDPYFIDWPSRRQINFPASLRQSKIDLVLTEQSVGVI